MIIKSAIRAFKRAKQYYLTTVFTLAITMSMVLSVFSLVDLVYFSPLPYEKNENLYLLEGTIAAEGFNGVGTNPLIIDYIAKNNEFFDDVAIFHNWTDYKLYDQVIRPEVQVVLASSNLFSMLGITAELGRLFNQSEEFGSKQQVVILSYRLWQDVYEGDSDVIGRKIQLNQRRFTVIGVAKDNLLLPQYNEINRSVWIPLDMDETFNPKNSGAFMGAYKAIVRLAPAADLETIAKKINTVAYQGAERYMPNVLKDFSVGAKLTPFRQAIQGDSGNIVLMLLVGVSLLMLIALINLSSMQLARAVAKIKTVAISFAFGATSKQLLAESFKHNILLIGFSVVLAWGLTIFSFSLVKVLAQDSIQGLDTLGLSVNTIIFSISLAVIIALLYSYIELSVVKEQSLISSLQSSGKGVGKQMSTGTSHALIGLQVAFSFMVLIAASHVVLMTLSEALRANGINTKDKWSLTINYSNIKDSAARINAHKSLFIQMAELPAINTVEPISEPRLPQKSNVNKVTNEQGKYIAQTRQIRVSDGYLSALGLSIVGDDFKPGDSELTTFPVMINQRLADLMNQDTRSLIGQKISMNGKNYHPIIGVVANTYVPGDSSNETYEVYLPKNYNGWRQYSFLISASDNALVVEQVRELALKIDPRLDISQLTTLKEQFDDKRQRHMAAAVLHEEVDVRVHTAGRRGSEGARRVALRCLGRTRVVDHVVLEVVGQPFAGIDALLQLGVGDVARDDQRPRK